MRSSKQRSRGKNNRNNNRSVGNVMNRVFDSSGPEGRVRGTPQQIIEKYTQLASDATLANDRVAAENFQQHSEHYLRLLSVAQREQEARREQQEREHRERQQNRDDNRNEQPADRAAEQQPFVPGAGDQPDIVSPQNDGDSGLVETPEAKPKQRRPRKPKVEQPAPEQNDAASLESASVQSDEPTKAAE